MSSPFQKKFSAKSPIGETPLTKKSPCYQTGDKRSGFQPNRANVELDETTRLTRDSQVLKDRKSGEVVVGGGYDSDGKFIPRTAAQKKSATEEQLAVRKAKAKADTRTLVQRRKRHWRLKEKLRKQLI